MSKTTMNTCAPGCFGRLTCLVLIIPFALPPDGRSRLNSKKTMTIGERNQ
jgi:hypothetical protein